MAHTKSGGSTKLGRDSAAKYLGVKVSAGESVSAGNVIVRQRGTKYLAGPGVRQGADDTLYAVRAGIVKFVRRTRKRFDGSNRTITIVAVG